MRQIPTNMEEKVRQFQKKNMGYRYIACTLANLSLDEDTCRKINTWIKNPKNMLVICAGPGFGKTHICAALTEWMILNFNTYRYHKEEGLLKLLRATINDNLGDWNAALGYQIDDDLVMLDDIGSWANKDHQSYKDNNWKIEVLFSFLDNRYNSVKPTILTSNLFEEDFRKIYSDRVASRIFATENTIIQVGVDKYIDQRKLGR